MKNIKMNRKEFLRLLTWFFAVPFIFIGAKVIKRNSELKENRFIRIPFDLAEGATFLKGLIAVKEKSKIRFLSGRCTHLGCQINSMANNELICPCHGSSFNLRGESINGPADEGLKELSFSLDKDNREFIIQMSGNNS